MEGAAVSWIVKAQWICTVDNTVKRFQRTCATKPSQQKSVNPVTGELGVYMTEMDPDNQREVWARFFGKVDWFEFTEVPDA
jgi:hypothetical protein